MTTEDAHLDKTDEVLAALDAVGEALEANAEAGREVQRRKAWVRRRRASGASYREIVESEERPIIVEILAANLERLARAGSRLRRAEAHALHREGLTMDRIAELFGVSRQRVSALLRNGRADDRPASTRQPGDGRRPSRVRS